MRIKSLPRHALFSLLAAALLSATALAAGPWEAREDGPLADRLKAAPQLTVENLVAPVSGTRPGRLLYVPNPDGETYDLLQIYFPRYGGPNSIAVIDLGTGEVEVLHTERGPSFHLCPNVVGPDGRLYISVINRGSQQLVVYDPATNEMHLDLIATPAELRGETHPLELGTDGMIYMAGGHPSKSVAAAQVDPATGHVEFYAPVGPSHAPNGVWAYSAGADDRYIYIASGKVPWYLVAYDRQTGESRTLVETEAVNGFVSVRQGRWGVTARATGVLDTDGERINYWLHNGEAIVQTEGSTPPWDVPETDEQTWRNHPPRPEVDTTYVEPDAQGFAEIRVRQSKDDDWQTFRYQVPIYPQSIQRLTELPDGRLIGTAGAYGGNFLFDPATGAGEHKGKIHLSHYATAIHDGQVYLSGYPSSGLYRYNPDQPWTANEPKEGGGRVAETDADANPRRLGYMKEAGTHKMYAAAVGADGNVYFGGQWIRNGRGGGLGWVDPATSEIGGLWEPFSNHQICFMTAVGDGSLLAISTLRVDDPLLNKPKPAQGALLIFDVATKQVVRTIEPVLGVRGPGPVVSVGDSGVFGWANHPENDKASILWAADAQTGEVLFRRELDLPLPVRVGSNQMERFDFRLGPDGMVWTFLGDVLVRIDPNDASIHPVGKVSTAGRLAFSGNHIYLGGTTQVRIIRDASAAAAR